jgi:hypothetical protein
MVDAVREGSGSSTSTSESTGKIPAGTVIATISEMDTSSLTAQQKAKHAEAKELLKSDVASDRVKGAQMMLDLGVETGLVDKNTQSEVQKNIDNAMKDLEILGDLPDPMNEGEWLGSARSLENNFDGLGISFEDTTLGETLKSNPNGSEIEIALTNRLKEINSELAKTEKGTNEYKELAAEKKSLTSLIEWVKSGDTESLDNKFWESTASSDLANHSDYSSTDWFSRITDYEALSQTRAEYLRANGATEEEIANDPYLNYYSNQISYAKEAYVQTKAIEFYKANPGATEADFIEHMKSGTDAELTNAAADVVETGRTTYKELAKEQHANVVGFGFVEQSYLAQAGLYQTLSVYHTELASTDPENASEHKQAAANYTVKAQTTMAEFEKLLDLIRSAIR